MTPIKPIPAGIPTLTGGENPAKSGTHQQIAEAHKIIAAMPAGSAHAPEPSMPTPVKRPDIADMAIALQPEPQVTRKAVSNIPYGHDDKGNIWRYIPAKHIIGTINSSCTRAEMLNMVAALNGSFAGGGAEVPTPKVGE